MRSIRAPAARDEVDETSERPQMVRRPVVIVGQGCNTTAIEPEGGVRQARTTSAHTAL